MSNAEHAKELTERVRMHLVPTAQQALGPVGREHTYALIQGPAVGSLSAVVLAGGIFAD